MAAHTLFIDPARDVDRELRVEFITAWARHGYTEVSERPALAVTCAEPAAAPALPAWPLGKGALIWQAARVTLGSPGLLADKALACGFQWLAFKIHDGPAPFNGDLRPWLAELLTSRLDAWGWGYNYGREPAAEARAAAARCLALGLRGYLIDAEGEWKVAGADAARTWCTNFKSEAPDVRLGLSSFRYPALHTTFPWAPFAAIADFHAPQLYWLLATTAGAPAAQLAKSLEQLRAVRDLPVVPIGCAFAYQRADGTWWRPTPEQLNSCDLAARSAGCPALGWYSWDAAESDPLWWPALSAHNWRG